MTGTGKTNRRKLREIGSSFAAGQLVEYYPARAEQRLPSTPQEQALRDLFADVLGVEKDSIGADDNFLQIGGDSVSAMRLVAAAKERKGLLLSVANVFKTPILSDLALVTEQAEDTVEDSIPPFSMIDHRTGPGPDRRLILTQHDLREQVASVCKIHADQIEDVYPCTPLQEGLLAMTAKNRGDYVSRNVMRLKDKIDVSRFQHAWDMVIERTPILRTRIVDVAGLGLMQVVVNGPLPWTKNEDLKEYLQNDGTEWMGLGQPLCRLALLSAGDTTPNPPRRSEPRYFARTLHHAVYDGWSMSLIYEAVRCAYKRVSPSKLLPFKSFVRHTVPSKDADAATFWTAQFRCLEAARFPTLPSAAYQPRADKSHSHQVSNLQWPAMGITPSTVVRATWSILLSRYAGDADDVVFGATVTGRQASVPGVDRIVGPTIATVPIRVKIDRHQSSIAQLLQQIQDQSTDMIAFEQSGLQRIRRVSPDAQRACSFQTIIVTQPKLASPGAEASEMREAFYTSNDEVDDLHDNTGTFSTYAIMVEAQLEARGLKVRVGFDSNVITSERAGRIASHFEVVLRQLCTQHDTKIADIDSLSEQDLREIWAFNSKVPEPAEACVQELIADTTRRQPESSAIDAWDGQLTYAQFENLSARLALHIVDIGPGSIVPLCFEKSMWTHVAQLAVMKRGGASLVLDVSHPQDRLRWMAKRVRAQTILSSRSQSDLAGNLHSGRVVIVDSDLFEGDSPPSVAKTLPNIDPSNVLYVVFTSGSTGTPKGVIITHRNIASAVRHQSETLGFSARRRVYQFVSCVTLTD